ncbi:hypothetical protein TNCV_995761 [Trichonephila clavipes]|nr:hypothetical protein TNCV_995761 [Trichonephila clavipes]
MMRPTSKLLIPSSTHQRKEFEPQQIYRASVSSTRRVFSGITFELMTHRLPVHDQVVVLFIIGLWHLSNHLNGSAVSALSDKAELSDATAHEGQVLLYLSQTLGTDVYVKMFRSSGQSDTTPSPQSPVPQQA